MFDVFKDWEGFFLHDPFLAGLIFVAFFAAAERQQQIFHMRKDPLTVVPSSLAKRTMALSPPPID